MLQREKNNRKNAEMKTIIMGGTDTERLFLLADSFTHKNVHVVVEISDFTDKGVDMASVIARHRGRYHLAASFVRPGMQILDFPCGTGYGSEVITHPKDCQYIGFDIDPIVVEFASRNYGSEQVNFGVNDLTSPDISDETYDLVCCLEGIEHIDQPFQETLVKKIYECLKENGRAVISSPVNPEGVSGKSSHNPDHLWELSAPDFKVLITSQFDANKVQFLSVTERLSTGVVTEFLYAIAQK